jgi:hypothetical protein
MLVLSPLSQPSDLPLGIGSTGEFAQGVSYEDNWRKQAWVLKKSHRLAG